MRAALRYAVVFVVAFVAGMAGALPVFVMGLSVPMSVVWPLTLLTGSLLATLSAGWVANFLASDGSRSRLLAIFGVSLLGTVVALLLYFAGAWVVNTFELPLSPATDLLLVYLPGAVVFLGATAVATWRLRGPGGRLGWSGAATLVLSACVLIFSLLVNPVFPIVLNFRVMVVVVWADFAVAILSLLAIAWCSHRGVSGRELARDAAITLCLLAAIPPVVAGTIYISCSTLGCGA